VKLDILAIYYMSCAYSNPVVNYRVGRCVIFCTATRLTTSRSCRSLIASSSIRCSSSWTSSVTSTKTIPSAGKRWPGMT